MPTVSFLFLVANTPWVYALAESLGEKYSTHATRFYDWRTYNQVHPTWPDRSPLHLQRSLKTLPPGYVGYLEPLFRPYLQWQVQKWSRQLQATTGEVPWAIVPYPFSAPWVRYLPPKRLVYYNLDEYVHYQPARKEQILAQEAELVDRAALTLCLSQFQVEVLQQRYPHKAASIHHFPLGVVDDLVNSQPEQSPEPMTVGYIGNLIDRVDWQLVRQVAEACPEVTFIFVGGLDGFAGEIHNKNWQTERSIALALPNVRHIGKVPQSEVTQYYWSFAVNWIPYDIHHPFNQASCPTKVMDGIASSRPVLSTDIPECHLYPEWIAIFYTVEEAVSLIRNHLGSIETSAAIQKRLDQRQFALQHTWEYRAKTLVALLSEAR
jgi:teichuronic acid biosynthesis glycosyltransferase TuaH